MLFEVLMARFDILEENRKAFLEIYKILKKNPQQFIKLLPTFLESMIITAELSKYKVNGLKGTIRLKGLMLIYFITFFQWVDEKNSTLEKTMTALDKNLDQAEKLTPNNDPLREHVTPNILKLNSVRSKNIEAVSYTHLTLPTKA